MNKLWIGIILMLLACNSKKDMQPKAVDIPMQKVLYNRFSKHDPSRTYNYREWYLYLINYREPIKRKAIFGDSYSSVDSLLLVNEYYDAYLFENVFIKDNPQLYSSMQITVFTNTDKYILLHGDSTQLAGELYLTSKEIPSDKIYVYYYDHSAMEDEDVYILLDYKKDLLLLYSPPYGMFYQYDSQERGQAYFDTLIAAFNPYFDYLWRKRYDDRKEANKNES